MACRWRCCKELEKKESPHSLTAKVGHDVEATDSKALRFTIVCV